MTDRPLFGDSNEEIWARGCFDAPEPLPITLPYEIRATTRCADCHTTIVGTKSGHLMLFRGSSAFKLTLRTALASEQTEPVWTQGIYAVAGCPDCAVGSGPPIFLIGTGADTTGHGAIFRLQRRTNADEAPDVFDATRIQAVVGRVKHLRLGRGTDGRPSWILCTDRSRKLHTVCFERLTSAADWQCCEGPIRGRWLVKRSDGPEPDSIRWILISFDGQVYEARWTPKDSRWDFTGRTSLAVPPREVVGTADADAAFLLYATVDNLRCYSIEADDARQARIQDDVVLLQPDVVHLQIFSVFGRIRVLAASRGPRIWSAPFKYRRPEDWHRWPDWPILDSDLACLHVPEHSDGRGGHGRHIDGLLVLRRGVVARLRIHNRAQIFEALKHGPLPSTETDAGRAATLRFRPTAVDWSTAVGFAKQADPHTREQLLTWMRQTSTPVDERKAVDLGTALLVSAAGSSSAHMVGLASELHHTLLRLHRRSESACAEFGSFVRFLETYYLLASTYSDKWHRLTDLVEYNQERRSADALIYSAILDFQGFDILAERRLRSGIWALSCVFDEGSNSWEVVASIHSGEALCFRVDAKTRQFEIVVLGTSDRVARPCYSRVIDIKAPNGPVSVVPRCPSADLRPPICTDRLRCPNWEAAKAVIEAETQQIYAMTEFGEGQYLLGTRNAGVPLLVWSPGEPAERGIRPVELVSAPGDRRAHIHGSGGLRRVWVLARLPNWDVWAVGAEDGFLHLVRRTEGAGEMVEILNEFRLGAPILSGVAFRAMDERRQAIRCYLALGTEDGLLFVFEVTGEPERPPTLILRLRDYLLDPIVSVFVDRVDPVDPGSTARRLFAVERSGRLSVFEVAPHPSTKDRIGGYLGRRLHQVQALQSGAAGTWVGGDNVVVAGWQPEVQTGSIRLVNLRPDSAGERSGTDREQALAYVENFAGEYRVELLRTLPIRGGVIRGALAEDVLRWVTKEGEDRETITRRLRFAVDLLSRERELPERPSAPDEVGRHYEFKCLLGAIARRFAVGALPSSLDRLLLEIFIDLLIDPGTGRLSFLSSPERSPKLRASIPCMLLTVGVLAAWPVGEAAALVRRRWISTLLHDQHRVVRLETCRALSVALGHLRGTAAAQTDEVFPGDEPLVARAGWLIDTLASYIATDRGGSGGRKWHTPATVWAVMAVLANVLKLMPDAALVIFDHLSIRGVNPSLFDMLHPMFDGRRPRDARIMEKLALYLPWPSGTEDRVSVLKHCSDAATAHEDYREAPDQGFLSAFAYTRKRFGAMIRIGTEDEWAGLCASVRPSLEPAPAWAQALWRDRRGFMQYTLRWLDEFHDIIDETPDDKVGALRAALRSPDLRLHQAAERLFEPERGIVRAILSHWRSLLDGALPEPGRSLGRYRLGPRFKGSPNVFEIEGDSTKLIATVLRGGDHRARWLVQAWTKLEQAGSDILVPIVEVIDWRPFPGLVVAKVGDHDLRGLWGDLCKGSAKKRFWKARQIFSDILEQIRAFAELGLAHCDVQRRNIVRESKGSGRSKRSRYFLVDFEHVRSRDEPPSDDSSPHGVERTWQECVETDIRNLRRHTAALLLGEEAAGDDCVQRARRTIREFLSVWHPHRWLLQCLDSILAADQSPQGLSRMLKRRSQQDPRTLFPRADSALTAEEKLIEVTWRVVCPKPETLERFVERYAQFEPSLGYMGSNDSPQTRAAAFVSHLRRTGPLEEYLTLLAESYPEHAGLWASIRSELASASLRDQRGSSESESVRILTRADTVSGLRRALLFASHVPLPELDFAKALKHMGMRIEHRGPLVRGSVWRAFTIRIADRSVAACDLLGEACDTLAAVLGHTKAQAVLVGDLIGRIKEDGGREWRSTGDVSALTEAISDGRVEAWIGDQFESAPIVNVAVLQRIIDVALSAGLEERRKVLVLSIPREVVRELQMGDSPADQLRLDVGALNQIVARNPDDAPPLGLWLRSAAQLIKGTQPAASQELMKIAQRIGGTR